MFDNLTNDELREWVKMLFRALIRMGSAVEEIISDGEEIPRDLRDTWDELGTTFAYAYDTLKMRGTH